MPKLFEIQKGPIFIQCDNEKCDYVIPYSHDESDDSLLLEDYIDQSCPKCGENLLTQKDYQTHVKFVKRIDWINKWFGWLMYILPKAKEPQAYDAHCHNGLHIKKREDKKAV